MNSKLMPWVAGGLAIVVLGALIWGILEYKHEQDLTADIQGRWEHVDKTKWLTVGAGTWQIERWDVNTKGWHKVDHGTWTVRSTGTFIFESNLGGANTPAKIDGDALWLELDEATGNYRQQYLRRK